MKRWALAVAVSFWVATAQGAMLLDLQVLSAESDPFSGEHYALTGEVIPLRLDIENEDRPLDSAREVIVTSTLLEIIISLVARSHAPAWECSLTSLSPESW